MNLDDAGRVVAKAVLQVVEGERTKTEMWGEGQFIVPRMLAAF
jgi:altronate dehydratase